MQTPPYAAQVHEYGVAPNKFQVNEFITATDFKMVDFDKNDLDTAYTQNTSIISYMGHMLGRARRQSANFKTRRDAVKAKVSKRVRDQFTEAGKKPTADMVDAEMRTDREFLAVSFAENHAIEIEATIEALYWAARGRRNDMEFFADKQRIEMQSRNFTSGSKGGS
jgi:hypothetical protein